MKSFNQHIAFLRNGNLIIHEEGMNKVKGEVVGSWCWNIELRPKALKKLVEYLAMEKPHWIQPIDSRRVPSKSDAGEDR